VSRLGAGRRVLVAGVVLFGVLLISGVVWAHQYLVSSEPADEAEVSVVPSELCLVFYEPVQLELARVQFVGPDGRAVSLGELRVVPDSANVRLGEGHRGAAMADLVNALSPTALVFAGVLVGTGTFATWLHVDSLEALWASAFGRTLRLMSLGGPRAPQEGRWASTEPMPGYG
jgi:methionine-rich copper-binding protein CopC